MAETARTVHRAAMLAQEALRCEVSILASAFRSLIYLNPQCYCRDKQRKLDPQYARLVAR